MKSKEDWFYFRKKSNCKSINASILNSGELFTLDFINEFADDCFASMSKKEIKNLHITGLDIRVYKYAKLLFIEGVKNELTDTFKPTREDLNSIVIYLEEIVDRRKRQERDFKNWGESSFQVIVLLAALIVYFYIKGDTTKLNFDKYIAEFTVVLGIALSAAPLVSKFIAYKFDTFYARKLFRENVNLEIAKSLELPLNLLEDYR